MNSRPGDAHVDVAIVGGGPAGAAAALTLLGHQSVVRSDIRVAIVERGAYERDKVGESLPPVAGSLLRQLGAWDRFLAARHRPAHGTISTWGTSRAVVNEFVYGARGHGWHLDRQRFDRDLADLARERGASVYTRTRVVASAARRDGPGYQITLDGPDGRGTLTADVVIDASGRAASFARRHGGHIQVVDQLLAIIGRVTVDGPLPDSYTLVEARPDGWSYCAELPGRPDEGGRPMLVAAMTDVDIVRAHGLREPQRWFDWVRAGPLTAERLRRATFDQATEVVAAGSQHLRSAAGDDWLAVGDAASCYDPLSSQGIVKALRSGIFGSYATLDRLVGKPAGWDRYAGIVAREFEFYRRKHRELHARERRWPDRPFWRRRQASTTQPRKLPD